MNYSLFSLAFWEMKISFISLIEIVGFKKKFVLQIRWIFFGNSIEITNNTHWGKKSQFPRLSALTYQYNFEFSSRFLKPLIFERSLKLKC